MSMQQKITQKLQAAYEPTILDVLNQSSKHRGHAGDDGSGESHFSITIQSSFFENMSRIEAQRSVYRTLESEMKIIHALSLNIKI